jgi:D-mannonate dehydratase
MVDSIEEHEIVEQIGYFSAGLAPIAAETGILLTL